MKLSYRTTTSLILIAYGLVFIGLFYANSILRDNVDVYNVSQTHYENKANERLSFLIRYFNSFAPVLNAIEENPDFHRFIDKKDNYDEISNLFLTVKKSINCIQQVRFIDSTGMEIIRVEGPATRYSKPITARTRVVPKDELQNKSEADYFKRFKNLPQGKVGISAINLNIEGGKVEIPKKPTLRFGIPIYSKGIFHGVAVINICLRDFFELFSKTTLYHVLLVDDKQHFVLHHDKDKGVLGDLHGEFSLTDAFGEKAAKTIVTNDQFFGGHYFSIKAEMPFTHDTYRLILVAKFQSMAEENNITGNILFGLMIITLFLTLPIALRLSKEPERLLEELDEKAHIDELTRLPNRTTLIEFMEEHEHHTVILVSIDGFYDITNLYGYLLADKLLQKVANHLDKLAHSRDMIAYHLESNQYALTSKCKNSDEFETKLIELHNAIEERSIELSEELEISISVTLGVGNIENRTNNVNEILLDAEIALAQARNLRYPYVISTGQRDELQQEYQQKIDTLNFIRQAVFQDNVLVHYQPIMNNKTGKIIKHEALMRLYCSNDTICLPYEFLDLAKTTKHYPNMTKQIIQQVVTQLTKIDENQSISINFSMLDISHPEVVDTLIAEVSRHKVAHRLIIEIVESEEFGSFRELLSFAKTMRGLGCQLAIDDFGSGYSNFQNIIKLEPYLNYLKIDGSIVRYIEDDATNLKTVKSIVDFANELGLETIAEFVHNQQTLEIIKNLDVTYSQGYEVGKPNPELQL